MDAHFVPHHKPQQGTLVIPDDTVWILGDEVRVHQVLVNVLSNALDACPHAAQITVSWQIQGGVLLVVNGFNSEGSKAAGQPGPLSAINTHSLPPWICQLTVICAACGQASRALDLTPFAVKAVHYQ